MEPYKETPRKRGLTSQCRFTGAMLDMLLYLVSDLPARAVQHLYALHLEVAPLPLLSSRSRGAKAPSQNTGLARTREVPVTAGA